jgi:cell division inhibitor SepF
MSVFRKAMVYLGLVDDERYDDEYEYGYGDDELLDDDAPVSRPVRPSQPAEGGAGAVTVVRTSRRGDEAPAVATPRPSAVRPIPMPSTRVHVMDPRGFNDAQEVGDRLKSGQPVILNLQAVDRDLQRRLIDFASGLAYALNGTMSKAADQVFLLTPSNVEVSDEEKERLQARGLYRAAR